MNYLAILQYLPAIITIMKEIENAIPGQGQGEAKLAAVREFLELIDDKFKTNGPQIAAVVGWLANLFNKTGVFKK